MKRLNNRIEALETQLERQGEIYKKHLHELVDMHCAITDATDALRDALAALERFGK